MNKLKYFLIFNLFMSLYSSALAIQFMSQPSSVGGGKYTFVTMHNDTDENMIGYAYYKPLLSSRRYILHTLWVDPAYRQQGYGSKLVQYVCYCIKSLKGTHLYV